MPPLALLSALLVAPVDSVRLVIVATRDLGGQVTDWDYLRNARASGGLARVATVIDSLRAKYPDQVVVVDAGGALAGNPLAAYYGREVTRDPHPVIEAMNIAGYDVATLGDRDFDFGASRVDRALAGAGFSWVSANLQLLPYDTLALAPFTVVQRNGVKVAITGFTTPGVMVWNGPRLRERFRVNRIEPLVERTLRGMREQAEVSLVLANSGLEGPSSYDTTGIGAENAGRSFATGPLRPDLVVLGHTREEIADTVIGGVHFVQPAAEGASVSVIHLLLVPQGGRLRVVRVAAQRLPLQDVRSAPRVLRRLREVHEAVLRWVSTPLGEAAGRFSLAAARVEDTPLMRFVHEALRRTTGATLSALPVVDVRAGFDPGEITIGELFRIYPYEYTLRAVRISGADLQAYLEQSARYFFVDSAGHVFTNRYAPADRYDVVGGASYVLDLGQPMGSRVTRLSVQGRVVQPTDTFTLALADDRQEGRGAFSMVTRAPIVFDRGITVREALRAELTRRKTLEPEHFSGRDWSITPSYLARRARALFVRPSAGEPEPDRDTVPVVAERVLPRPPSRAELYTRDSLERARQREIAAAAVVIVTLRLPAEPGPGGGLGRLLADAYRTAVRADVAVLLLAEATTRLPARGLTAAEIEAAALGEALLLTIQMSGADLEELLENVLARQVPCCELSGVRVEFAPADRPWDRVRRARLTSTGKGIERKRSYTVAISSRLLEGDGFSLGSTGCRPVQGCRTPGNLSRWKVERTGQTPAETLREYLRHLPQPVNPPDDPRLLPVP